MRWIIFIFLFSALALRAQDHEYVQIYKLIGQADSLNKKGESRPAVESYQKAQDALKKFQHNYPKWNENVVKFRLDYIAEKLQLLGVVAVVPEKVNAQKIEVPRDAAILEQKLVAIQKERDLLRVAIDQQKTSTGQKIQTSEADLKKLQQLEQDESELRDRLAIVTKDKTASKKDDFPKAMEQSNALKTEPQIAEAKPVKKDKQLPAGAGTLVAQAERAFQARRFDEAEKKYLEVLRQDEKNVYILGNLAATQLEMDHIADVEKNIARALAVDPEDAFSLTLLGMVRFRQKKFDEALDALNRSAKLDSQNPETQNYLGITLSQKGQRVPAEAALRNAIKIQPNYAGAHHNLAVIYASDQPPFLQLARWHYEKALALGHPKNPELEKMIAGEK
jgi:tetratricopeptide (TPR) repeat protein